MAKAIEQNIVKDLFLPGERTILKALGGRLVVLSLYLVGFVALSALGFMISLHWDYRCFLHYYATSLIIGSLAIFGDLFWLLRTSALLRSGIPWTVERISSELDRVKCLKKLRAAVFGWPRLGTFVILTVLLGEITFAYLGLQMPSLRMKVAGLLVIGVVFGLLGAVISVASGFWLWLRLFRRCRPVIEVFHPDRMGGMRSITDATEWAVLMGGVLVALYAVGAQLSPYAHMELRPFSYAWDVLAIALILTAFFLPSHFVHSCLVDAHKEIGRRIENEHRHLDRLLFEGTSDSKLDIERRLIALIAFASVVERLDEWPYRQKPLRLLASAAVQIALLLLPRILPALH